MRPENRPYCVAPALFWALRSLTGPLVATMIDLTGIRLSWSSSTYLLEPGTLTRTLPFTVLTRTDLPSTALGVGAGGGAAAAHEGGDSPSIRTGGVVSEPRARHEISPCVSARV